MDIVVFCPGCGNRYQLKEEMRGKLMRCVNAVCHEVFEIHENGKASTPPAPPPAPSARPTSSPPPVARSSTGYIGEMVPFVSTEAAEPDPTPTPLPTGSSTVGDMVPLVSAEAAPAPSWQQAPPPVRKPAAETPPAARAQPPAPPPPAPAPNWQSAAPPVRRSAPAPTPAAPPVTPPTVAEAAPPKPAPPPPAPKEFVKEATKTHRPERVKKPDPPPAPPPAPVAEGPKEVSWNAVAPPPMRRGATETISAPAQTHVAEPEHAAEPAPPSAAPVPASRRFGLLLVVLMLLVAGGAGVWFVLTGGGDLLEEETRTKMLAAFESGNYGESTKLAEQLAKSFPDSPYRPMYDYYGGLSRLLVDAGGVVVVPEDIMGRLRRFIREWEKKEQGPDFIAKTRDRLKDVVEFAIKKKLDQVDERIVKGKLTADDLKQFEVTDTLVVEWVEEGKRFWNDEQPPPSVYDRLGRLRQIVEGERKRQRILAELRKIVKPTLKDLEDQETLVKREGLDKDSEVKDELERIRRSAVPSVAYERVGVNVPAKAVDVVPSALVLPRVGEPGELLPGKGVVFAQARGVLYALGEHDGRLLWAKRVGIDATHLPIRVAATEANPDLVLVLAAHEKSSTLTARRLHDGWPLWQLDLGAACLGRPLLVERDIPEPQGGTRPSRRVYLATVDARVLEVEISTGALLGQFKCGEGVRFLVGGTREPDTGLLYFPADRNFVFVFDVTPSVPQCVTVLRTGHPSGSLRGAPVLVSNGLPVDPSAPAGPRYLILSQASGLDRMQLRAWELPANLSVFSDKPIAEEELPGWSWFEPFSDGEKIALATDAGVLGLFGIRQKNNVDPPLFPLLGKEQKEISLGAERTTIGRSQVIQGTENDFWVLARTEAQHWRVGIDRRPPGLRIGPKWPRPVPLGSPLHAGQADALGKTLFTVTQSLASSTCLVTAVDAVSGEVRWQRQLGMVGGVDPVTLNGTVIALDRAGGLFAFDPAEHPQKSGEEWQFVQTRRAAGPPATETNQSYLLRAADAVLAVNSAGDRLSVRRYLPGKKPGEGSVQELAFTGTLAGAPVVGANALVYPDADGTLHRQPLTDKAARPDRGQQWRAENADADARGYVVALGENDFLCTDGSRGLRRVHWPAGPIWQEKELKLPTLERVAAAPLALPATDGKTARVVVADVAGTLTLLQGEFLQKAREWKLAGAVTSGPFLAGKHVGCVLDRNTLVWIDPDRDQPVWTYADPHRQTIVGQPRLFGDRLVVAHLNGKLLALDVERGEPQGNGFATGIAPAAAPAAFGEDRLLMPLTDGTLLVLPLDVFKN